MTNPTNPTNDGRRVALLVENLAPSAARIGGRDALTRYAVECLEKRAAKGELERTYTAQELTQMVDQAIDAEPDMLTWTPLTAQGRATGRSLAVSDLVRSAELAANEGELQRARRLMMSAERLDPDAPGVRGIPVHRCRASLDIAIKKANHKN